MADEESGTCRWCGEAHGPRCPWVKAVEFNAKNGAVTRVEFMTPADCAAPRRSPEEEPAPDYPRLKPSRG